MAEASRKLKILFVTLDTYPPLRPAARAIFAEEFVKRGHRVDWITQAKENCPKPQVIPFGNGTAYIGATDDGTSRWRRLRKHLLFFMNDLRMFRLIKTNHYDVIQVKDKHLSALLAILAAKLHKTKLFYWLAWPRSESSLYAAHNKMARYRIFYLLRGWMFKFLLYRIILPASDFVFVQSEQMKKDIMRHGIPAAKMTPVPGSVNLENIPYSEEDVRKHSTSRSAKNVVYLGTLTRTRRLDFMVSVIEKVRREAPDAKLYFVGSGGMPEDEFFLQSEVSRRGVKDAVIFTGHLPMKEAWGYIRLASVCVSPYYPTMILNSTSPTKLIEYMAMGKPVVGNDHPEQRLVIEESGAGYCVPWDEDAFAEAVVKILKDPANGAAMGKRGRRYVEKYRTNRVMAEVVEHEYFRMLDLT